MKFEKEFAQLLFRNAVIFIDSSIGYINKGLDNYVSFTSGGNDLPCAILAQVFTLYSVAVKHSKTVCAPIVMDAIFQQEPAEAKINMIWDYVTNHQPAESQLILSTTSIHNRKVDGKVISFIEEKGLLKREDYQKENDNIIEYRELLLNELKKRDKSEVK